MSFKEGADIWSNKITRSFIDISIRFGMEMPMVGSDSGIFAKITHTLKHLHKCLAV